MAFDYLTPDDQPQDPYTLETFNQWAQPRYGRGATEDEWAQLQQQVGPGGTQEAYQQAADAMARSMGWQGPDPASDPNDPGFFPTFEPPQYEAPTPFEAPAPFEYEAFQAPTMEAAMQDPSFQFALQQGMNAILNNRALAGTARTGGTLKDLMAYGQNLGMQHYGDIFNRAASAWTMNRQNAAENYARNYDIARNTWMDNANLSQRAWENQYRGASDAFNALFRSRELTFEDLFRRWATNVDAQTRMAIATLPR